MRTHRLAASLCVAGCTAGIIVVTAVGACGDSSDNRGSASDAGSGAPDVDLDEATPELGPVVSQVISNAMASSALAALLAEVASEDQATAFLGLQAVAHGDVLDTAQSGLTAADECAAGGTASLDRCPEVVQCGQQKLTLSYGDRCFTRSGKRMRGLVRIVRGAGDVPWTWELAVSFEGPQGNTEFTGLLQMTRPATGLVFNQTRDQSLAVRTRGDTLESRPRLRLENITLRQQSNGDYAVSGPNTFYPSIPVKCADGGTVFVDYIVEDCGGWQWPAKLSYCLCPTSGELRLIGPLLDPCNKPTAKQTLAVKFSTPKECGDNFNVTIYSPETQCAASCGACDAGKTTFPSNCASCSTGLCVPIPPIPILLPDGGAACSNSAPVTPVVAPAINAVCRLPQAICAALADGGVFNCPDGGVVEKRDAGLNDASADGSPLGDAGGGG